MPMLALELFPVEDSSNLLTFDCMLSPGSWLELDSTCVCVRERESSLLMIMYVHYGTLCYVYVGKNVAVTLSK